MSMVSIRIASDVAKLSKAVGKFEGQVARQIALGLNEGGDKVRTQVRRTMREQTGLLRLNSVTKRQRTLRAYEGSLSYAIVFAGKPPTKPAEFRTRVAMGKGGGVTVWLWNTAHKFKRSFRQKFKLGLRMRLDGRRVALRSFDGPNLAKEAVKDDVAKTFLVGAAAIVPAAVEKRLGRL